MEKQSELTNMASGPRKGKMKSSPKAKTVAYTPLSEKEKDAKMRQLIKNLHDPNHPAGNYRSPGGPRFDVNKMKQV